MEARCSVCGMDWMSPEGLINVAMFGGLDFRCSAHMPELAEGMIAPPGSLHPSLLGKAREMSGRWKQFLEKLEREGDLRGEQEMSEKSRG